MPKFTPQQLDELYHQTLAEFAASPEKWTSFLDTAARLYKYDFKSQVLIWSQRPDATACARAGRCGTNACTAASIAAQTVSVSLITAAVSRASSICSIFRILHRATRPSHRRISGRCVMMHRIQCWTVSLLRWAKICTQSLIFLSTCICPRSALQIRKPASTPITPI